MKNAFSLIFCSEHKALKNKIKREKESNVEVKTNKTKGDYHDKDDTDAGSGFGYGYGYEEYGNDYGYGSYYDENNSANEHLGMFRSAHKGNHLPSKSCFPCRFQTTCIFQNTF